PRSLLFSFTASAPTALRTLSLHDALPICDHGGAGMGELLPLGVRHQVLGVDVAVTQRIDCKHEQRGVFLPHAAEPLRVGNPRHPDRKSTRLNSSHVSISYAVFCLKKKK